ncbi:hypothetical protein [Paenibacillus cymbidii]|uniref:hypothetical protein n=1 Tax=Paenibacillus cymbidii TaxID=1639034 RepID=UPI001F34D7B0|nr:hypothetical protein [Paenibacillus cymbidii]
MEAAAQFQAPGALITDDFQREITDALRRNSVLDGRLEYTPATGDFSTYYEQNEINGGEFVNPRSPSATPVTNARSPHSLKVKAITNQVNFGHYDVTLGQQQGNFEDLQAKDLDDMLNAVGLTHGKALWRGSDTSLSSPTTLEYRGIAKQITNIFRVGMTSSIVAGIRAKVAAMIASEKYLLRPSAIYIDPIALYYLEEEEREASNNSTQVSSLSKTVVAGIECNAILTAAGKLPLIPEPFMLSEENEDRPDNTDYGIAIVTERMIEYHYVGKKGIYLFELGTVSDLQQKYIGIKYGAPVAKGPGYAHAFGKIERPTLSKIG